MLNYNDINKAIMQKIELPFISNVSLHMLRLDLIDNEISGNKWFKLKKNLEVAAQQNKIQLITFGGAYSNHIAATAKACKLAGIQSVGIIRGEKVENNTLNKAMLDGMQVRFVTRDLYRNKEALYTWVHQEFDAESSIVIPEGGANVAGVEGCKEIVPLINIPFDYVCAACGTGTTLAGIVQQLSTNQKALGFSTLKGGYFLYDEINKHLSGQMRNKFSIVTQYHFGGYAKHTPQLLDFMKDFYLKTQIQLDFIYTAKMMYGLFDLIQQNYFPVNSQIVVIHSGGLQGNQGIGI